MQPQVESINKTKCLVKAEKYKLNTLRVYLEVLAGDAATHTLDKDGPSPIRKGLSFSPTTQLRKGCSRGGEEAPA